MPKLIERRRINLAYGLLYGMGTRGQTLLADADLIYDKRCKHGKLAQHYAAPVLDGRFDLRDSDNYMRETVLNTAVRYGRLEVVAFLLRLPPDGPEHC
jgi:hypothetical protein